MLERLGGKWRCGWVMAVVLPLVGRGNELWVDGYFSDDCVLQRGARVAVWGKAVAGAMVEVGFRGGLQVAEATALGDWRAEIGPYEAGGPDIMEIRSGGERIRIEGVLVGDVWLCLGQSNMAYNMAPVPPWTEGVPDFEQEIAWAGDERISLLPMPRFVYHEEWPRVEGRWRRSGPASVRQFSAVAWYMAQRLLEQEDVAVGMIVAAIGSTGIGSWLAGGATDAGLLAAQSGRLEAFREEIVAYGAAFAESFGTGAMPPNQGPSLFDDYIFIPSGCFNALVAPLTRYPVAGWVWYQGEGNARRAEDYGEQLRTLIADYRARWRQPGSPFIVVQLPGWEPVDDASGTTWARLREQQRRVVLETPGTALVVTLDVGDAARIHPRDKRPVGIRSAEAARALRGMDGTHGLVPASARMLEPGSLGVAFSGTTSVAALQVRPGLSLHLEYADGSRSTVREVRLEEPFLKIGCPEGSGIPVAVEYAFSNNPVPAIFLPDGSPLAPFRLTIAPKP